LGQALAHPTGGHDQYHSVTGFAILRVDGVIYFVFVCPNPMDDVAARKHVRSARLTKTTRREGRFVAPSRLCARLRVAYCTVNASANGSPKTT
jgi:hypothetical protein